MDVCASLCRNNGPPLVVLSVVHHFVLPGTITVYSDPPEQVGSCYRNRRAILIFSLEVLRMFY